MASKNIAFNLQYLYDTIITMLVRRLLSQGSVTARHHWMIQLNNAYLHNSKCLTVFMVRQKLTGLRHPPSAIFTEYHSQQLISLWQYQNPASRVSWDDVRRISIEHGQDFGFNFGKGIILGLLQIKEAARAHNH
jgi:hypothetical protein